METTRLGIAGIGATIVLIVAIEGAAGNAAGGSATFLAVANIVIVAASQVGLEFAKRAAAIPVLLVSIVANFARIEQSVATISSSAAKRSGFDDAIQGAYLVEIAHQVAANRAQAVVGTIFCGLGDVADEIAAVTILGAGLIILQAGIAFEIAAGPAILGAIDVFPLFAKPVAAGLRENARAAERDQEKKSEAPCTGR